MEGKDKEEAKRMRMMMKIKLKEADQYKIRRETYNMSPLHQT